jgi:DNA-binding MarR family transcriptional regulator
MLGESRGNAMVKLLPEENPGFVVKLSDLHDLEAVGLLTTKEARRARREIDQNHIYQLVLSDPDEWPKIIVTRTDAGYVVIDGYHRWEAARKKKMQELQAECKPFADVNAVIEAVFRANMKHGLKSSVANMSNYARWLKATFPNMKQEEIADRCQLKQSTVSKALKVNGKLEGEQKAEEKRKVIIQDCKRVTRDASRLLDAIKTMSEAERRAAITEAFTIHDRETLTEIVRLLGEQQPRRPGEA